MLPKQVVRTSNAEMETFLILVGKKVMLTANILNINFHIKVKSQILVKNFSEKFMSRISKSTRSFFIGVTIVFEITNPIV